MVLDGSFPKHCLLIIKGLSRWVVIYIDIVHSSINLFQKYLTSFLESEE